MTIVVYSEQLNALAVLKDDPSDLAKQIWEVCEWTAVSIQLNEVFHELLGSPLVPWFSWDWIFLGEL